METYSIGLTLNNDVFSENLTDRDEDDLYRCYHAYKQLEFHLKVSGDLFRVYEQFSREIIPAYEKFSWLHLQISLGGTYKDYFDFRQSMDELEKKLIGINNAMAAKQLEMRFEGE